MLQLQDLILCMQFVKLAGFRLNQKVLIYLQSNEFSDILRGQQSMVYGILQVINLIYMLSLMLIGQVVLMIGRVLVEQHFFLEDVL